MLSQNRFHGRTSCCCFRGSTGNAAKAQENLINISNTVGSLWRQQQVIGYHPPEGSPELPVVPMPPLPRITENKFSMQSWFKRLVNKKLKCSWSCNSFHRDKMLAIIILQPVKHGGLLPSQVVNSANVSDIDWRNCPWPKSSEIAWPNTFELEEEWLLQALNSLSIFSRNRAVFWASSDIDPSLLMAKMPAATEWLKTWAARLTLIGLNGGNSIWSSVNLSAMRISLLLSTS